MSKTIEQFLDQVPVFTLNEFVTYLRKDVKRNVMTMAYNLIKNRRRSGKLGVVKEGLYYVVKPGTTPASAPVDEYLVASKLAPDAMLAFHSALDALGFGHSVFTTYYYFSKVYRRPVRFRGCEYQSVKVPQSILDAGKELVGSTKVERSGIKILITDKERTLVEALEHPEYCGGFEEMYRSLEKMPYVQTELILKYLNLRGQKNLFARVGFFLEQHREQFHVEESFLQMLERQKPTQPLYWDRSRKGGVIKNRWNLIVPEAVDQRKWEEF
jgi:predicted transcriptional regulator of viral defense system